MDFEVDADERVSLELKSEILNTIKTSKFDWHQIPVENYIDNKLVKFVGAHILVKPHMQAYLKKGYKQWGFQRVHPKIKLRGKRGFDLKNSLVHYYCKNISDLLKKLDNYSSARAIDLKNEKKKENLFKNFRRIFSRFWKCFFSQKRL